ANLANLGLARSRRRERELVARAALGASRGRLVRQLLIESTLLGVAGGIAGLLVAYLGLDALTELVARTTPRAAEIGLDGWVLAFTLVLSVGTGLVFGLMALPPRFNLARALRTDSGRGSIGSRRRGLRGALVVGQVALAMVLLAGAGLMIRSFLGLQRVQLGFDPDRVLTAEISLNWSKYSSVEGDLTPEEAAALSRGFWHDLLDRLNAHPEVVAAAAADRFPFATTGSPFLQEVTVEGRPEGPEAVEPRADLREASPGFFEALSIPVLQGRAFSRRDHADAPPVAIVNRSAAEHFWGERDPVGRRLSTDDGATWATVVGVVADTRGYGAEDRIYRTVYRPMEQTGGAFRLIARTRGAPDGLAADLEGLVYSVDPDQPVAEIRPLERIVAESVASPRLTALLLGLFAALAVAIAVTGITGSLAFAVGQRTRELSLRMALGAHRAQVAWLVVRHGVLQVALGVALGLVLAQGLGRFVESLLFGVEPADPGTLVTVAAVLLAAAGAACWLPARRATEIPPAQTLQA
ncbi:MAG: ABC transporter permease, partial [Acidobacteriota bacterium]